MGQNDGCRGSVSRCAPARESVGSESTAKAARSRSLMIFLCVLVAICGFTKRLTPSVLIGNRLSDRLRTAHRSHSQRKGLVRSFSVSRLGMDTRSPGPVSGRFGVRRREKGGREAARWI